MYFLLSLTSVITYFIFECYSNLQFSFESTVFCIVSSPKGNSFIVWILFHLYGIVFYRQIIQIKCRMNIFIKVFYWRPNEWKCLIRRRWITIFREIGPQLAHYIHRSKCIGMIAWIVTKRFGSI